MSKLNLISRRSFLNHSFKLGLGVTLTSLVNIPPFVQRALAEGTIGQGNRKKKLLFIFLRGANDGLNSVVPVEDGAYYNMGTQAVPIVTRPDIAIPRDLTETYTTTGLCFDPTQYLNVAGGPGGQPVARGANDATYAYNSAIRLGNGFAALHPSLKFLAPVYNAGDLALLHRVGYPRQSRSHFDSQNYWENGAPLNNLLKDGVLYRTVIESGLANTAPLTAVSIQSSLPLLLRGSAAALTNLSDVTRYSLLGVPYTNGVAKASAALAAANNYAFVDKKNRDLLRLQYQNLQNTLPLFSDITADLGTNFVDDTNTDNDFPYTLFPSDNASNGGYTRPAGGTDAGKYVVPTGDYGLFNRLKAAALVLNKTDAFIAGTELGGFDTHNNQGGVTGTHANLQRRIGWAIYALRKYFSNYAERCQWNDLVIVTLTEFGRTTVQNSDDGTDHAEAGVMFVAGGAVKGYNKGNASGVFGCHLNDPAVPWVPGPPNQAGGDGSMFAVSDRYLRRAIDYRSVLGEIIREHLGAEQPQLDRIIPGYAVAGEKLFGGGASSIDNTPIRGELNLV